MFLGHPSASVCRFSPSNGDEAEPTEPTESTAPPNAAMDADIPEQCSPTKAAEPSNNLPVKEELVQAKRRPVKAPHPMNCIFIVWQNSPSSKRGRWLQMRN